MIILCSPLLIRDSIYREVPVLQSSIGGPHDNKKSDQACHAPYAIRDVKHPYTCTVQ